LQSPGSHRAIHWLIQALVKPYQFGKDVEVMLTIRACERRGIKTALLVTYEYGGKDGVDSPLLYYVPEADAVVSTRSRDRWIELPEAGENHRSV
jgi:Glycine/sarcosine/betaine reductase component B subunits